MLYEITPFGIEMGKKGTPEIKWSYFNLKFLFFVISISYGMTLTFNRLKYAKFNGNYNKKTLNWTCKLVKNSKS